MDILVNRNEEMLKVESTKILFSKTFGITIALLAGHTQNTQTIVGL